MKIILSILFLLQGLSPNNTLTVDSFDQGAFDPVTVQSGDGEVTIQEGSDILGGKRRLQTKVSSNPFGHGISYGVTNSMLAISAGYDTRGTVFVSYGKDSFGTPALNQNLEAYTNLVVQFDGKSTANGIYVAVFTGTSRSVYSATIQARESLLKITVPLSEFEKVGANFTWADVDAIRFQFDSRNKTGCNMAIDRIWFE